jgi:hypothetical protein
MYPCGGPIVNSKTSLSISVSVVLCGETYKHPDGDVEGWIGVDHACVTTGHRHPVEDLHLYLEGPTGKLWLMMSSSEAREMAKRILSATDPERN